MRVILASAGNLRVVKIKLEIDSLQYLAPLVAVKEFAKYGKVVITVFCCDKMERDPSIIEASLLAGVAKLARVCGGMMGPMMVAKETNRWDAEGSVNGFWWRFVLRMQYPEET